MNFSVFSDYLSRLESTGSRNSMVEILSGLFSEVSLDEIDKIIYLTQGRVAPMYEKIEFGVAEKTAIKAIARACEVSESEVLEKFKKTGDLGEASQNLTRPRPDEVGKSKSQKLNSKVKITDVFRVLLEIAKSSGEGAVEKKIAILADLIKNSDSLSAKYVIRIVLDKLRLGFADQTVLEGLSWTIDGTKSHKDDLEKIYNVRPDLGFLAKKFKEYKSLKVAPLFGTPVLPMRAERLTSAEEILEKTGGECAVEEKLDGLRTQLHFRKSQIKLFSRGLEDVTAMYPDLVEAAKNELSCESVILDGEAIGFDPKTGKYLPFQETVTRKRKYDVDLFSQSVPMRLVVFDVLSLNGESLINKQYQQRRQDLEKLLGKQDKIVLEKMVVVKDPKSLDTFFKASLAAGLEGIMAKKLDGVYQAGARGWNWIKYKKSYDESKLVDTVDAVVMGLYTGEGKRTDFGVGAFLVGVYDAKSDNFKTVSKIGTGLTDEEWRNLKDKSQPVRDRTRSGKSKVKSKPQNYEVPKSLECDEWLNPELVGEFKADLVTKSPLHSSGFALRFPRLVRWREKKATDTTSIIELERLAKLS